MDSPDRRRAVRLTTRLSTTFKNLHTGIVQQALTRDISGEGVCLLTEEMLEPGTPLAVEIHLPDYDAPIAFLADVVWSMLVIDQETLSKHPLSETGVKYVSIDPKLRTCIMQYAALHALPPEDAET